MCLNTPGDNESGSYEINLHYNGGGSPEEWFVWKDKLLKASGGQGISTEPLRYTFTDRLLKGDASAIGNDQTCISSICFPQVKEVPT